MAKKSKVPEKQHNLVMRIVLQYLRQLRFYLVAGLMVWVPLIITAWVTWWLFKNLGLGVDSMMRSTYARLNSLGQEYGFLKFMTDWEYRDEYSFLIPLAIFLTTGFLTRYIVWRRVIGYGERFLDYIPFVKNVYRAVQQIRDTFVSREGGVFEKVCLVEYPREGIYAVGFVTNTRQGLLQRVVQKELHAVFIATTPNPTTGLLIYVPPPDILELRVGIEDAMKMIISGGAFVPKEVESIIAESGKSLLIPH